jgi:hypothetical protein
VTAVDETDATAEAEAEADADADADADAEDDAAADFAGAVDAGVVVPVELAASLTVS